jgi:Amidohydrolase
MRAPLVASRSRTRGWRTATRPLPGRPYVEPCIELFGAERCKFESNFPVDKMGTGYATLWNTFKRITAGCSHTEKLALYSGTAVACGFTPRSVRGVAAGAEPEVRIHLPPADSPSLASNRAPRSRTPAFRAGVRAMGGGAVGRDRDRLATWRLTATKSLLGQIPVPQCQ